MKESQQGRRRSIKKRSGWKEDHVFISRNNLHSDGGKKQTACGTTFPKSPRKRPSKQRALALIGWSFLLFYLQRGRCLNESAFPQQEGRGFLSAAPDGSTGPVWEKTKNSCQNRDQVKPDSADGFLGYSLGSDCPEAVG